jgi:hypothetical protein
LPAFNSIFSLDKIRRLDPDLAKGYGQIVHALDSDSGCGAKKMGEFEPHLAGF